jgi:hypothetical protein
MLRQTLIIKSGNLKLFFLDVKDKSVNRKNHILIKPYTNSLQKTAGGWAEQSQFYLGSQRYTSNQLTQ